MLLDSGPSTPAAAPDAPAPGSAASSNSTLAPRRANCHATAHPTTPPPITVTSGDASVLTACTHGEARYECSRPASKVRRSTLSERCNVRTPPPRSGAGWGGVAPLSPEIHAAQAEDEQAAVDVAHQHKVAGQRHTPHQGHAAVAVPVG